MYEIEQGLQIGLIMIYLTLPPMGGGGGGGGGGGRPGPHPETEIPNMALEWARTMQLSPPTSEVGGSIPVTALSGKAGSCLPLVGSLQYTTLANSMYWFPLPFQLPVVIWPVQCWKRRKTPNKQINRTMQFYSMVKTEFSVKIWARFNNFRGCFELNCHLRVLSLHALPIHVFSAWCVFLKENTT